MDSDLTFYLERFKMEEDGFAEADRKTNEWVEKRNRHQTKIKALLQLAVDRALEVKQPLSEELINKATNLLGPQIHQMFKDLEPHSESKQRESGQTRVQSEDRKPVPLFSPESFGERPEGDGSDSLAAPPNVNGLGGSRIDWIAEVVAASGNAGITPPQILRKSVRAGIKMHENYPYVALRKLVERKRVEKKGARYYKAK